MRPGWSSDDALGWSGVALAASLGSSGGPLAALPHRPIHLYERANVLGSFGGPWCFWAEPPGGV